MSGKGLDTLTDAERAQADYIERVALRVWAELVPEVNSIQSAINHLSQESWDVDGLRDAINRYHEGFAEYRTAKRVRARTRLILAGLGVAAALSAIAALWLFGSFTNGDSVQQVGTATFSVGLLLVGIGTPLTLMNGWDERPSRADLRLFWVGISLMVAPLILLRS